MNIGRQQAGLTMISMGLLYVIMTGGIDLASGSVMALSSVMVTFCLTTHEMGMAAAVGIPLLLGGLFGLLSGVLVSWLNMAPFIVTLAIQIMVRGLAFMISNGNPVLAPANTVEGLASGIFLGLPVLIWLAIAVVLVFWFIQHYTTFGRKQRYSGVSGRNPCKMVPDRNVYHCRHMFCTGGNYFCFQNRNRYASSRCGDRIGCDRGLCNWRS